MPYQKLHIRDNFPYHAIAPSLTSSFKLKYSLLKQLKKLNILFNNVLIIGSKTADLHVEGTIKRLLIRIWILSTLLTRLNYYELPVLFINIVLHY